jgi:hypothetical protein
VAKPVLHAFSQLGAEIAEYLRESEGSCCLIANERAEAHEPAVQRYPARVVYRGEVYHLLRAGAERAYIDATVMRARSIPTFYGVLSRLSTVHDFSATTLGEDDFRAIVTKIDAVFVGAFDGEGYLMWRRH